MNDRLDNDRNSDLVRDRIIFPGMKFHAYHGVFPEERKLGQEFIVDVEAFLDLSLPGRSDRLEDTLDYARLYELVKEIMLQKSFRLIEAVAETIAASTLQRFPAVETVCVRVRKVRPPIPGCHDGVTVEIVRPVGKVRT